MTKSFQNFFKITEANVHILFLFQQDPYGTGHKYSWLLYAIYDRRSLAASWRYYSAYSIYSTK